MFASFPSNREITSLETTWIVINTTISFQIYNSIMQWAASLHPSFLFSRTLSSFYLTNPD